MERARFLVVSLVLFVVLATANGGGYRYGVSDQAFYIPAVIHAADPATFPRDAALIDAQARLMVLDEVLASTMHATGIPLPALFAAGYVLSLVLIYTALLLMGESFYVQRWATAALLAAYTLRHQITRTSTNTLEPYFHPRMLAFGICTLGLAALMRRKPWLAIALVAAGGVVHPTTACWFAVLIGVALIVAQPQLRRVLIAAGVLVAASAAWALLAGPLRESLVVMDEDWRLVLASKTTLMANQWPVSAWLANLGTAAVLAWAIADRRRRGIATPEDAGLAAGATALVALFLVTLPFVAAGVSFFVELQISRVFWLVDLLATIYALGAVERLGNAGRAIRTAALVLLAFSVGRGSWVLWVERPERRLFAPTLEASAWHDAMRWLSEQPVNVHVLADPGHAWKYGTSVRVSAARDVFLEDVKDAAIAIYSRDVAMRVLERTRAVGDFTQLTTSRARELAAKYHLDYVVTTGRLDLPVAYRNQQMTVYALSSAEGPYIDGIGTSLMRR